MTFGQLSMQGHVDYSENKTYAHTHNDNPFDCMPWMQQGIGNDKWKLHQRYVGGTIHQHHTLKSKTNKKRRKSEGERMNKNEKNKTNKIKRREYRTVHLHSAW